MSFKINSYEDYKKQYQQSVENPEQFWSTIANTFSWRKKWDTVLKWNFDEPNIKWFVNGKLNITENCLDGHLATRGNQTAIVWEPNNPNDDTIKLTYHQLHQKVCEFANVLKLNDEELPVLSDMFSFNGELKNQLKQLLNRFNLQTMVYTMGEKGSIILNNKEFSFMESPQVVVADTVGAGDSFTAVLVSGVLKGVELTKIHEAAIRTAAYVCTQKGATPVIPFDIF